MSKRDANRNARAAHDRMEKLSKAQQRRGVKDENKSFAHQNAQCHEASKKASWWWK